ncbi:MAG: response regulator [Bdellovibrionaceae bacterium]|nr:response regulator [Pseudobdellovibrionaceae bacterium]
MIRKKVSDWSPKITEAFFIVVPLLLVANLSIFFLQLNGTERTLKEWNQIVRPADGGNLPAGMVKKLRQSRLVSVGSILFLTVLGVGLVLAVYLVWRQSQRQQNLASRSLLDLQEKMNAVLHSAPLILWAMDNTGACTMAQGLGIEFLGDSRSLLGRNLFDELADFPVILGAIRSALSGQTCKGEYAFEDRWYETTMIPMYSRTGVKGMVGISVDITDRKNRELEVELANQAKSRFLANMSHEIRTPLGLILGFIDLLAVPDLEGSEREKYMSKIRLNAEALAALVNDILDLSKVEAGRLDVDWAEVGVQTLLNDLKESFETKAVSKGLAFSVETKGELPKGIRTDPTLLRQILVNLLGNAVKFTERGAVRLVIESHPCEQKSFRDITFQVIDTGVGIMGDHRENLFDPFRQGDPSTARRYGGTGLGLALSHRLAELIGGDLQLISTVLGGGSVFQLNLHAEISESFVDDPVSLAKEREEGLTRSVRLAGLRVLMVEDSVDNQVLVSTLLKRNGAEVSFAGDGKEGVEKASVGDWDLVLMDIQMPGMDGFEATRQLRERGFTRPILALTAHALREERDKAIRHGFDDYLTKPVDRNELISKIESYGHGPGHRLEPDIRQEPPETRDFPRP